ncbi:uncharacterized protein LOC136078922 [Hydra vulgaris]|uniref:Uncharacterized protein LOC136078922 n=1 Tax=Hydra vulgaris TaxID=6087 RepID=A0ABM4BNW6_HYDVU
MAAKGNTKIKLSVFNKWDFKDIFGWKIVNEDGIDYINFIWCKICANRSSRSMKPREIRGATKLSSDNFTNGTNFITKHTIQRHLASKTHQNAAEIEKRKPKEDLIKNVQNVPAQTSISSNIEKASHDAYQKLINTAYKLAVNRTISLNCFSVLVEIQKENGTSDGRAAKKFISSIYSAVLEKSNLILNQSHFYSILSDGWQARKTGVDKELVLLKTTLKGSPVTMFAHLIDCNDYGGTDIASLKLGIDSIFDEDGPLP